MYILLRLPAVAPSWVMAGEVVPRLTYCTSLGSTQVCPHFTGRGGGN